MNVKVKEGKVTLSQAFGHATANLTALPAPLSTMHPTRSSSRPGQPPRQRWYGGIKAANGSIYGIPHTATGVLKITPETQQVEIIGLGLPEGGWKWHGGEAGADRKYNLPHLIYAAVPPEHGAARA